MIHAFAFGLFYTQAVLASLYVTVWLTDKVFDSLLRSLHIYAIFTEFLIDRCMKHGSGIRRRKGGAA